MKIKVAVTSEHEKNIGFKINKLFGFKFFLVSLIKFPAIFIKQTKKVFSLAVSHAPAQLFPKGFILKQKLYKQSIEQQPVKIKRKLEQYFLNLTNQEQIMFAKRLGQLIKAGVPILPALNMLKKQASSKNIVYIMESLHEQVEAGVYLSAAMQKFKKFFGEFAINIVRVGEVSGTLQENLNYLAQELKKKQELKRRIISAWFSPSVIVLAPLVIVFFLLA